MIVISFFMAIVNTFFNVSSSTIITEIVDDNYISVNSLSQGLSKVANSIGPIIGGILIGIIDMELCFVINGISFIISGITELMIENIPNKKNIIHTESKKIKDKMIIGFKILKENKFLLYTTIIGGGFINFFLAPISIYLPLYIKNYLHLGSKNYGLVVACITLGGIFVSVMLPFLTKYISRKKFIVLGFVFQGISLIIFGYTQSILFLGLAMFVLGFGLTLVGILLITIIQEEIPTEVLGKTSSASNTICYISIPVGFLFGGFIVEIVSINLVLKITGVIVFILGLIEGIFLKKLSKGKSNDKNDDNNDNLFNEVKLKSN